MKRLYVLIGIMVLIWPIIVYAWNPVTIGGRGVADESGPCDNLGTSELYYDVDHTSGDTYACISGGTQQGTWSGASASSAQNNTTDGTYSILLDSSADDIRFTITGGDIYSSTAGYVSMMVYCDTHLDAGQTVWMAYIDGNDSTELRINAGIPQFRHKSTSGGSESVTSANTISDDTWTQIQFRWNTTGDTMGVKVGSNAWEDEGDTIDPMASEPSSMSIGNDGFGQGIGDTIYIDDFQIWTTYDQS